MKLLETTDLVKTYSKRKVVDRVGFEVHSGEIVGLLGPNGAGKTTAFRMTIGMITADSGKVMFNGEDVTELLHTPEYDQKSSQVATRPEVRARLVELQREIAGRNDVVMEGRDIGTVVLPDADVKLFLRATPEVRARRRVSQREADDYEATLVELEQRDERDASRAVAPLKPARDATIIDTDRKTLAEVISAASNLVRDRLGKRWRGG